MLRGRVSVWMVCRIGVLGMTVLILVVDGRMTYCLRIPMQRICQMRLFRLQGFRGCGIIMTTKKLVCRVVAPMFLTCGKLLCGRLSWRELVCIRFVQSRPVRRLARGVLIRKIGTGRFLGEIVARSVLS